MQNGAKRKKLSSKLKTEIEMERQAVNGGHREGEKSAAEAAKVKSKVAQFQSLLCPPTNSILC